MEIWKYPEAERLHKFHLEADVTCAEFRPDGAQLACLLGRDVPGIWCWEGWSTRRLGEGGRVFSFLSYSGDSRFLAAASDDRKIHLWNAQTLESVAVSPPQDTIAGLSLNEHGTWLAAGTGEEVRIWESHGGLLCTLPAREPVWRVFFSPKGDLLAVVHDKGVQMWDARTGERLGTFAFRVEHAYFQVAFSSDGTKAAWGNSSRGCGGPWMNPRLGFYSLKVGGVITTMGEAPRAAGWAFQ
jgi:WD40 repeat protein